MSHLRAVPQPSGTPPTAYDAEREILAIAMSDPANARKVLDAVQEDHFYGAPHRAAYRALVHLDARNIPADPITMSNALREIGAWEMVGGFGLVSGILDRMGLSTHLPHYAAIVKGAWAHRQVVDAAEAIRAAGSNGYDLQETLAEVDRVYRRLGDAVRDEGAREGTAAALCAAHEEMIARSEQAVAAGGTLAYPFGLRPLDESLHGGLWPGEQCVIMGARSQGKSALALQLSITNAKAQRPVYFVSAEMPGPQVYGRLVSSVCGVPYHIQRGGRMDKREREAVFSASQFVGGLRLQVVSAAGKSIRKVERDLRDRFRSHGPPAVIVLDYAQRLNRMGQDQEPALTEISGAWKSLALEFNCASVLLTQPNNASTKAGAPRMTMADSKGAGSIPDDADVFLVVHRPEWNEGTSAYDKSRKAKTEIVIEKQREGANVGHVVQCRFRGDSMSFTEDSW